MTRIGYALCKVRFYALKVPFWRGRSRFPQGAMHYEILCIISSCIMRYSTVVSPFSPVPRDAISHLYLLLGPGSLGVDQRQSHIISR